jgi:hypothetical protein
MCPVGKVGSCPRPFSCRGLPTGAQFPVQFAEIVTVSVIVFKEFQKSLVAGSAFKFELVNWTDTETYRCFFWVGTFGISYSYFCV